MSFLSDSSSETSPVYLHVLLPNEKSPFTLWFSRFDEEGNFIFVDHYGLVVSTSLSVNYYPSLSIISDSSHEGGGSLFIEGNLKNTGSAYIDRFNVYATF